MGELAGGERLGNDADHPPLGGEGGVGHESHQPHPAATVDQLLGIRRETTVRACADAGLEPWTDPQNADPAFTRVRVRTRVLPLLEAELGPGVAEALARTADQLREDAEALDSFAEELAEDLAEHAEAGISLDAHALAANPPALRQRLIRLAVASEFGVALSRQQTLEVAEAGDRLARPRRRRPARRYGGSTRRQTAVQRPEHESKGSDGTA